ncbi:MAG: site-specific integrase [Acidobacteriota bacterium]
MTKTKGVYLRNGIAYIRFEDERGRDVRESTGQGSVRAAAKILAKRKTDVALGKHFRTRRFARVRFSTLRAEWWEHHGQKTRSSFSYLLPRIDAAFGGKKARSITSDDVQSFLDGLSEALSASSVNHHRTILNSIFNWAIRRDKYDENPVRGVRQFQEPPGRNRIPSRDEFQRLLATAKATDLEVYVFLIVATTTTLRKGEILQRQWSEVVLDSTPHVRIPKTKNGRSKTVPLPGVAVEALKLLPSYNRRDYLFPSTPTGRHPNPRTPHVWDLGPRFRDVRKAAGVEGLRIHDLRHAGPSILLELGIADSIVRKVTGHRSRELERYQHLSPELRKQTVELIAQALIGTPTGTPREAEEEEVA